MAYLHTGSYNDDISIYSPKLQQHSNIGLFLVTFLPVQSFISYIFDLVLKTGNILKHFIFLFFFLFTNVCMLIKSKNKPDLFRESSMEMSVYWHNIDVTICQFLCMLEL
jgi:hypothetical protein